MGGWAHTHARPSRAAPSTAFALPYSILATLSSISERKILASPSYQGVYTRAVWLCGPHSCLPHCDLYFIRSPAAAVKLTPSRGDGMSSKLTTIFRAFRGKAPGRAADLHSVTRLDINTGIACCLLYTALMEHPPQSLFLLTKSNPKRIFIFTKKGHTWTRVWRWFCRQRSWGRESQVPPGTGSALASGCGACSPAST